MWAHGLPILLSDLSICNSALIGIVSLLSEGIWQVSEVDLVDLPRYRFPSRMDFLLWRLSGFLTIWFMMRSRIEDCLLSEDVGAKSGSDELPRCVCVVFLKSR